MPEGDRTGPRGQGPGTGMGRRAGGHGQGSGFRPGPGGKCLCPSCGEKVVHRMGNPCFEQKCPKCGAAMTRE